MTLPPQVPATYPAPVRASGRRAQLRRRRRRRRMQLGAAALAATVVACAALIWWALQKPTPQAPPVQNETRTQQTLLFQLRSTTGVAMSTALLAHDPASSVGAAVLVPRQVIVPVPGAGSLPLERAVRTTSPEQARAAVGDLLEVSVDAGWLLDEVALAGLVDRLGGVEVDVDAAVLGGANRRQVIIEVGRQRIDGARAAAYVDFLGEGEPEQTRLARTQRLLEGVLQALPASGPQVVPLLQLGPGSRPSIPVDQLAALLVGLKGDLRSEQLQFEALPVIPIDPGNGVTAFRRDVPATRALADRLLEQSLLPGAREAGNRVLVLNGVGTPGLGEKVRPRLIAAGLVFAGSQNAPRFGYPTTQVLVADTSVESRELGLRVARAVGVPDNAVRVGSIGTLADAVLLLGADVKP